MGDAVTGIRVTDEEWLDALARYSMFEYSIFLRALVCGRKERPQVIRNMLAASGRAGLGKRAARRAIAALLLISPDTVRYYERKERMKKNNDFPPPAQ